MNRRPEIQPAEAGQLRILALAMDRWSGPWFNRQQILSRLAKTHPVLYSRGPWEAWSREDPEFWNAPWFGGWKEFGGVWVDESPRTLVAWQGKEVYDRIIRGLVHARWRRKLDRFGSAPTVAYLFHPIFLRHIHRLDPDFVVYHAYDLFRETPGWSETLELMQRELLARADAVIASSSPIQAELSKLHPGEVNCVPNGVDLNLFGPSHDPRNEPADIAVIPKPRIGYVGKLNMKVDFKLISELARKRSDWQFVLVGPIGVLDEVTQVGLEACRTCANVHFLGLKERLEVPDYMRALDVGLQCYREDGLWWQSGYPLKLHEYLAIGLPVVSTGLDAVREFEEVVFIARGAVDWERRISEALSGVGPASRERRYEVAAENSWDRRVASISEILRQLQHGRLG